MATGSDGVVADRGGAVESTNRREQILQTAQKLFADNGFRETNLNDVAIQLGFRRQAVYHYFLSKDEILYELIDSAGQGIATSAQPTFDAEKPSAEKLADAMISREAAATGGLPHPHAGSIGRGRSSWGARLCPG
jgi:AcrR family transcriptional regulator